MEAAGQGWGKKEGHALNPVPSGQGLATAWPQEAGCLGRRPVWGCQRKEKPWGLLRLAWGGGAPHHAQSWGKVLTAMLLFGPHRCSSPVYHGGFPSSGP